MKKVICMFAVAFALTTASAQDNSDNRQRQRVDRTEMMVKEYNLNAEQTEKVKALNEKYKDLFGMRGRGFGGPRGPRPQAQQNDGQPTAPTAQQRPPRNFDGQMPNREEMEKRMKERREKMEAYDSELKQIMTKEQYAAYEKNREEMRMRRPQPRN